MPGGMSGKPSVVVRRVPDKGMYDNLYIVNGNVDYLNISGLLRLAGTNAALTIGEVPPTSSTAGTGLWLDRTGLYVLYLNDQMVAISLSTGAISFGYGTLPVGVAFGVSGITVFKSSVNIGTVSGGLQVGSLNQGVADDCIVADGAITGGDYIQGPKVRLTPEGGIAVLLTAEEALYAGEVVMVGTAAGKVVKNATSSDKPIGVVYANASANASVWVVVAGTCNVLPDTDEQITLADIIYSSAEQAGRVDSAATVGGVADHNDEIGHALASSGTNGTAVLCVIHFN